MDNYDEIQSAYFEHHIRTCVNAIEKNISTAIQYDKLSVEEFSIICNSLNNANDIICMISKNQQK